METRNFGDLVKAIKNKDLNEVQAIITYEPRLLGEVSVDPAQCLDALQAAGGSFGTGTGLTPLHFAVIAGNSEVVLFLLGQAPELRDKHTKSDDDFNNWSLTPLSLAIYLGQTEMVALLIKQGVDIDLAFSQYEAIGEEKVLSTIKKLGERDEDLSKALFEKLNSIKNTQQESVPPPSLSETKTKTDAEREQLLIYNRKYKTIVEIYTGVLWERIVDSFRVEGTHGYDQEKITPEVCERICAALGNEIQRDERAAFEKWTDEKIRQFLTDVTNNLKPTNDNLYGIDKKSLGSAVVSIEDFDEGFREKLFDTMLNAASTVEVETINRLFWRLNNSGQDPDFLPLEKKNFQAYVDEKNELQNKFRTNKNKLLATCKNHRDKKLSELVKALNLESINNGDDLNIELKKLSDHIEEKYKDNKNVTQIKKCIGKLHSSGGKFYTFKESKEQEFASRGTEYHKGEFLTWLYSLDPHTRASILELGQPITHFYEGDHINSRRHEDFLLLSRDFSELSNIDINQEWESKFKQEIAERSKKGWVEKLNITFQDKHYPEGQTAKQQAQTIIDHVLLLLELEHPRIFRVGIACSNNEEQSKVMQELSALLHEKYQDLIPVIKFMPLAPKLENVVEQIKRMEEFVSEGGVVLGLQNQYTVHDEDHPFAILSKRFSESLGDYAQEELKRIAQENQMPESRKKQLRSFKQKPLTEQTVNYHPTQQYQRYIAALNKDFLSESAEEEGAIAMQQISMANNILAAYSSRFTVYNEGRWRKEDRLNALKDAIVTLFGPPALRVKSLADIELVFQKVKLAHDALQGTQSRLLPILQALLYRLEPIRKEAVNELERRKNVARGKAEEHSERDELEVFPREIISLTSETTRRTDTLAFFNDLLAACRTKEEDRWVLEKIHTVMADESEFLKKAVDAVRGRRQLKNAVDAKWESIKNDKNYPKPFNSDLRTFQGEYARRFLEYVIDHEKENDSSLVFAKEMAKKLLFCNSRDDLKAIGEEAKGILALLNINHEDTKLIPILTTFSQQEDLFRMDHELGSRKTIDQQKIDLQKAWNIVFAKGADENEPPQTKKLNALKSKASLEAYFDSYSTPSAKLASEIVNDGSDESMARQCAMSYFLSRSPYQVDRQLAEQLKITPQLIEEMKNTCEGVYYAQLCLANLRFLGIPAGDPALSELYTVTDRSTFEKALQNIVGGGKDSLLFRYPDKQADIAKYSDHAWGVINADQSGTKARKRLHTLKPYLMTVDKKQDKKQGDVVYEQREKPAVLQSTLGPLFNEHLSHTSSSVFHSKAPVRNKKYSPHIHVAMSAETRSQYAAHLEKIKSRIGDMTLDLRSPWHHLYFDTCEGNLSEDYFDGLDKNKSHFIKYGTHPEFKYLLVSYRYDLEKWQKAPLDSENVIPPAWDAMWDRNEPIVLNPLSQDPLEKDFFSLLSEDRLIGSRLFEQLRSYAKEGDDFNPNKIRDMSVDAFIDCVFKTTQPTLYPETGPEYTQGWNAHELQLLGNTAKYVKGVTAYTKVTFREGGMTEADLIQDHHPQTDFLYFNSPLISEKNPEVDFKIIFGDTAHPSEEELERDPSFAITFFETYFNYDNYKALLAERILPGLIALNNQHPEGFIFTTPALGCEAFAGLFRYAGMKEKFEQALQELLAENQKQLNNLKMVVYTDGESREDSVSFLGKGQIPFVSTQRKIGTAPQLDDGIFKALEDTGKVTKEHIAYLRDNKRCAVVTGVAGDPVAHPTNDFNAGLTTTHEGGTAFCTNVAAVINHVRGFFNKAVAAATNKLTAECKYEPLCQRMEWRNHAPTGPQLPTQPNYITPGTLVLVKENDNFCRAYWGVYDATRQISSIVSKQISLRPEKPEKLGPNQVALVGTGDRCKVYWSEGEDIKSAKFGSPEFALKCGYKENWGRFVPAGSIQVGNIASVEVQIAKKLANDILMDKNPERQKTRLCALQEGLYRSRHPEHRLCALKMEATHLLEPMPLRRTVEFTQDPIYRVQFFITKLMEVKTKNTEQRDSLVLALNKLLNTDTSLLTEHGYKENLMQKFSDLLVNTKNALQADESTMGLFRAHRLRSFIETEIKKYEAAPSISLTIKQ